MATFRQRPVGQQLARGHVRDVVETVVTVGARSAARLAPRDFGTLANSVQPNVRVVGRKVHGTIGTNLSYAAPNEFGTHALGEQDAPGKRNFGPARGRAARPFIRPGLVAGLEYARSRGLIR